MKNQEDKSHILPESDSQLKKSLAAIYIFAALMHITFLFIFSNAGVKEMKTVNYFSPFIYMLALYLNQKDRIIFGVTIGIFEAVIHGVLSLFFVGWQAYFHIYILLVYLLIFFLYNITVLLKVLLTVFVTGLYIIMFIYISNHEAKYSLPHSYIVFAGIVNIISTAGILSLFAIVYSHYIHKNINLLKNAEKQQRALNAQKNKFFSIFSHDLKNPITTLNGFVDIMLHNFDKIDNNKKKDFLIQIHNSANDLNKLVVDLLEWSRSQLDNMHVHPEKIDVGPILLEIKSLMEHFATQKNIQFTIEAENNLTVFADDQMFRSVMRNLISNAIKFTHRNGTVKVTAISEGNKTTLNVIDNGIGISPANLESLFRIDKKIISRGTENETGTGLGLIVAKEFVEKNKGTITVNSVVEQGTTFTVTFPSK